MSGGFVHVAKRGAATSLPLLAELRAGTRAAHARMEANDALARLLSPDLRAADYVYALRSLHALHAGIAARLSLMEEDLPAGCSFDSGRLALLDEDLAWFGAKPARPLGMARCIRGTASGLGALYVLEGSALGARIIGKAVHASLGVVPSQGGSFFCCATADSARARWITMSGCLNEAGATMNAADRLCVVRGANNAFAALERAMQRGGVAHPRSIPVAAPFTHTDPASAHIIQPAATGQVMN